MNTQELEHAVMQLNREELSRFTQWFDDFRALLWDRQIAQDVKAGRFEALIEQANQEFETGRCREI